MNSVGLANPGMEGVAARELPWLQSNVKRARVIVNVVGSVPEDYTAVIARLDEFDIVSAYELNVSCPNTAKGGEEFGADTSVLVDLVRSCRAVTRKPVIVKLAPTLPDVAATAEAAAGAGADGFAVVNTIPGILLGKQSGEQGRVPRLGAGQGGVSGPALLAVGVLAVRRVRQRTELPVIGVGGVRTPDDLHQYLDVGASLVAVGTAALVDPRCPGRLARSWERAA